MDNHGFIAQAFIYLLATVAAVPLAKRLGLGSVLGYLLAGVIIGPFVLGLLPPGGSDVMHFAEFGVVMMLFVIGLELKPALLWQLRGPILGLGGLQVVVTAAVATGIGMAAGLTWKMALALGLIVAMSSTAIVLQSLNEKGLMKTPGGEACFSVLLFQDIAVIPILALLPLLAAEPVAASSTAHGLESVPSALRPFATIGAVVAIVVGGRFLLRPLFRFIAAARVREVFTATALLLVIGTVMLMEMVGLSPAFGAFVAGVVLAESEYRHQLEADIEPFKGLLLGLFFISVGASLDFILIARQPGLIAALVLGLIAMKFIVLLILGKFFGLPGGERSLFAFALAQGGEFAFVLLSLTSDQNVLTADLTNPMVATVALSMALTPLLLVAHDKLIMPRFAVSKEEREADEIDEPNQPVILAGFGRFGHIIGRLLRANGIGVTVLDTDADQIETLRKFGMKCYYGDASRADLLHTAGAERARLFILAIDDEKRSLDIIDLLHHEYPKLPILARAASRQHAYELLRRGVPQVYRETLGTALDLSIDALRLLGIPADQARRAVQIFKENDETSVRDMATMNADSDTDAYASRARLHIENLERALESDRLAFRAARAAESTHNGDRPNRESAPPAHARDLPPATDGH